MDVSIVMPAKGIVKNISQASDDTFSRGLVGAGFVLYLEDNVIHSPITGKIVMTYPTRHVMVIRHELGFDLMIHLGLNEPILRGEIITEHVQLNDIVHVGDPLLSFPKKYLDLPKEKLETPVVFINKKGIIINHAHTQNKVVHMSLTLHE
jgi:glucose-specific phosphotransferase system IIA component